VSGLTDRTLLDFLGLNFKTGTMRGITMAESPSVFVVTTY